MPEDPPDGLEARGLALWAALLPETDLSPSALLLVAEVCRIADRLELLDRVLRGEAAEWGRIRIPRRDDGDLVLVIDGALTEARQQAATLRQLVATLQEMFAKESDEGSDALAGLMAGLSAPLQHS